MIMKFKNLLVILLINIDIVHNFYNAPAGQDEVSDQYNTLCTIEKMIAQYVSIKIANQSE